MKNIFKASRKKKIENLGNEFINALQENGLELDPQCTLIDIWVHRGEDVEVDYTGDGKNMEGCASFKLRKK